MTFVVEDRFIVRLGGTTFIDVPTLVAYNGESLFTLKRHDENGYLGIYFEIYDSAGKHIASVKRNEIYYGDKSAFKIDGSLNRYVFSERESGRVICDIKKREDAHPAELDVAVHLYTPDGFLFDATPDQTNLPAFNMTMRGTIIKRYPVGIAIESYLPGPAHPQQPADRPRSFQLNVGQAQPSKNRAQRRAEESKARRKK